MRVVIHNHFPTADAAAADDGTDYEKAGARLARTGGGYSAARWSRENNLSTSQQAAVERGFEAEKRRMDSERNGSMVNIRR